MLDCIVGKGDFGSCCVGIEIDTACSTGVIRQGAGDIQVAGCGCVVYVDGGSATTGYGEAAGAAQVT